ncbi:hypothetical protein EAX61_07980 [Dokdonia sinensis]|uniref:Uncharacterized protein n=1 Tax=Dokdonia sinensis TaxID=2479847 RepID=A0A3M0G3L4_9FLAO|nr:hypothetical protein [Dokdonia sinensis]RMB59514.1 hypothetical protein EAX61_07980 [Dokdonia sinensis]
MTEKERKKEIDARIVRDDPKPISIGNGVHREESKLAQKEAKDESLKRTKTEEENKEKRAQ